MISSEQLSSALREIEFLGLTFAKEEIEAVAFGLSKTQDFQKSKYETLWDNIKKIVESQINEGKDFSSIIKHLFMPFPTNPISPASEGIMLKVLDEFGLKYDLGNYSEVPNKRLAAVNGEYKLIDKSFIDFFVVDCVLENLGKDIDLVVEFGSGWGSNLSRVLMGSARRDLNYISCEQSESGRAIFQRLFGLLDGISFSCFDFDFYSPEFNMIKDCKHVLAFTSAAIEQIPFLPMSFFDGLLGVAEKVTIVLYEPIGWQRSIDLSRLVITSYFDEFCGKRHPVVWHSNNFTFRFQDEYFLENSAAWSLCLRYNANLLNQIKQVGNRKGIELQRLNYDVYSGNPLNPYSLAVLKKC